MAKKIEMKAMSDEDKKINDIKHMAQRIEAAILETMEQHPDYENLSVAEGTTILVTAICEIFQTIADVTKTNVNDHLDIFMNGIELWKQS
jgi:hypothetical protein